MLKQKTSYKLTIIIPFYNAFAYRHIIIENIKRNNYDFVYFILIDDGSEDDLLDFLKEKIKNINVTYIKNEHNYGVSKSRNIGIQECKTEFLLFCDGDDDLDLAKIKDINNVFDKKPDFQIYAFKHTDKNGFINYSVDYGYEGLLKGKDLLQLINSYLKNPTGRSMFTSCWGRIYKTKFLKQNNIFFNEALCIYEDSLFVAEVITKARRISICRSDIYKHWLHGDGMTVYGMSTANFCDHIEVLCNFLKNNKIKNVTQYQHSSVSYFISRTLMLIKGKSFLFIYKNLKQLLTEEMVVNSLKSYEIQCIKIPLIKSWMFKNISFLTLFIFLYNKIKPTIYDNNVIENDKFHLRHIKKRKRNKKITISIIIPVFNNENRLSRSIKSVLNQTNINLELIIVDDGSNDTSPHIAEIFASYDERVKVIRSRNGGPSAARNIGISHSIGEFIFFLDSDDCIYKDTLEHLLIEIKKSNVDLAVGDFFISDDGSNKERIKSGNELIFPRTTILNKFKFNNYISHYLQSPNRYPLFTMSWGRLFKASIIKEHNLFFNEKLWHCEGVDFNFRYSIWADKISFVRKNIINHTVGITSLRMRLPNDTSKFFGFQQALASLGMYLEKMKINKNISNDISHAYVYYTIIQLLRLGFQYDKNNKKKTIKLIRECISETKLQNNLKHYKPKSGESKIIPFLIKTNQPLLLLYICRIKGMIR